METKYYSCKEVAERYGVKETTVWGWVKDGKLPAYRLGRIIRVSADALKAFEEQSKMRGE